VTIWSVFMFLFLSPFLFWLFASLLLVLHGLRSFRLCRAPSRFFFFFFLCSGLSLLLRQSFLFAQIFFFWKSRLTSSCPTSRRFPFRTSSDFGFPIYAVESPFFFDLSSCSPLSPSSIFPFSLVSRSPCFVTMYVRLGFSWRSSFPPRRTFWVFLLDSSWSTFFVFFFVFLSALYTFFFGSLSKLPRFAFFPYEYLLSPLSLPVFVSIFFRSKFFSGVFFFCLREVPLTVFSIWFFLPIRPRGLPCL